MKLMSWAGEIRCLYCGSGLALFRKMSDGHFCSDSHRRLYLAEQEQLALSRLRQEPASESAPVIDTLLDLALRDPKSKAFGLRPAAAMLLPVGPAGLRIFALDPISYEAEVPAAMLPKLGLSIAASEFAASELSASETLESASDEVLPAADEVTVTAEYPIPGFAKAMRVPRSANPGRIRPFASRGIVPVSTFQTRPIELRIPFRPELPPDALTGEVPPLGLRLFSLPSPLPVSATPFRISPVGGRPLAPTGTRTRLPLDPAQRGTSMPSGSLRSLAPEESPRVHGIWVTSLAALPTAVPAAEIPLSTPRRSARGLGMGTRFRMRLRPVEWNSGGIAVKSPEEGRSALPIKAQVRIPATGMGVKIAEKASASQPKAARVETAAAKKAGVPAPAAAQRAKAAGGGPPADKIPPFAAAVHIPWDRPLMPPSKPVLRGGVTIASAVKLEPLMQASKLSPMDPPRYSEPSASKRALEAVTEPVETGSGKRVGIPFWQPVVHFWQHAPTDLKVIGITIPLLLLLIFNPAVRNLRIPSNPQAGTPKANASRSYMPSFVTTGLRDVRRTIADRAGVALADDFRAGLDAWRMQDETAKGWSYDELGFLRPGVLGLYQPSMTLRDYEMEFLSLLDKKSVDWVVRASDFDNYYAIKLTITRPGPLAALAVVRYPVVDGKKEAETTTKLPRALRIDVPIRLRVVVKGNDFSVFHEGELIDYWSEPRLPAGGVGFFSEKGEEARVRWVQVSHQYDTLGRLCAFLAP